MIYCANCGTPLPDDAAFCGNCGTKTGTAEPVAETTSPGAAPTTDLFPVIPSQRTGIFEHPNWLTIKKYIVYFMAACFLWTLFNVFTVKYNMSGWRDEPTSARSRVAGYNLLFGSLPNIYVTEEGETKNVTAEANEDLRGPGKRMARVPMILRIAYWVFLVGFILYAVSVFDNGPKKQWLYSVGMVTAFLGLLSVYMTYNDIERKIRSALNMFGGLWGGGGITFSLGFTIGFWGLFLSFLLLMFEYIFNAIASFSVRMNPVQQNPAA